LRFILTIICLTSTELAGSHMRIALGLLGLLVVQHAAAADAPAAKSAAHPKGQYAALNSLPDWGGVWVLSRPPRGTPVTPPAAPKLKGEYLTRYQAWQKEVRENSGVVRRDTSNCMPPGMPNMMGTAQYPIEFLFTPGRVTLHLEAWMQWRSIYTDGRGHPEDLEPGIFGHSVGRWDNDALLVETVGIKTITEMGAGIKHSDQLKVIERFALAPQNPDELVVEMTLEDPQALEEPYKRTHRFQRQRDWALMEFICAENDRNPVNEDGYTQYQ
jgi:hypothetical protein